MLTSLNLSEKSAKYWRANRKKMTGHILRHCVKLSRLKVVRDHAISYNRKGRTYVKISIRFSLKEYNLLRYYAHVLRMSVSRILDAMIRSISAQPAKIYAAFTLGSYFFSCVAESGLFYKFTEIWSLKPVPRKNLSDRNAESTMFM